MRDAELRTADCFYALKSFEQAGEYYDRVLARGVKPMDYALFQSAMAAKLNEDPGAQVTRLEQLLADFPESRLVVEALFQASRTHIEEGALAAAEDKLNTLIQSYSATPRAKEALVELCLVHVKQGEDDKVLSLWDNIRTNYGNDNVAADAYNIVEPLLIQRGLLDNLPPAVGLDGAEIEQRFFESASYLALEDRCAEAIPRLSEYVRQYPGGTHMAEAQFYLANCLFDQNLPTRHTCRTWRCSPCPRETSAKPPPSGPPPSPGTTDSTAKPWGTTRRWKSLPPCSRTGWRRPSAKCAATTSWARRTKRPTSPRA